MAAAATSPVSASSAKEVEVEAEAEAATKELGAEAPITGRATNQARARSGPRRAAQPQRRAPSAVSWRNLWGGSCGNPVIK